MNKHVTDLGSALVASGSTLSGELTVVSYPDYLLTYAQHLANADSPSLPELPENLNFGLAVVLAHTACEVWASRVYWSSWRARHIAGLDELEWQTHFGHNLANTKFRKEFKKVTGKDITQIDRWSLFVTSSEVRQKIIHGIHRATSDEASDALKAARAVLDSLR